MDTNQIVDQVVALVRQKLAADKCDPACVPEPKAKPVLILYENSAATHWGSYQTCVGADCPSDVGRYEAVVLGSLSCKALFHIANGLAENAFETAAVNAFLSGKKVFLVKEGVELLEYTHCAPQLYYKNLYKNLEILLGSGAVLVPADKLCETLETSCKACGKVESGSALAYTRRMLSLADVKTAEQKGYSAIRLENKTIISALAAEYAKEAGLKLIK